MNHHHQNYINKKYSDIVLIDEPMRRHSTFGIGGNAKILMLPKKLTEIKEILQYSNKNKISISFIGSGSNLLVSDSGFDGIVISLKKTFKKLEFLDDGYIVCQSGVMLGRMVKEAIKRNIKGLESLVGVPGTLGGALYMNAGAYEAEISKYFVSAKFLDFFGNEKIVDKKDVTFSYRESNFPERSLLIEAKFKCDKGDLNKIKDKKIKFSNSRKESQPLKYRSAGSIFKNPSSEFAAGYLIDKAGLKGVRKGGAMISNKHANFIVNLGNASSGDVFHLIELIKERVFLEFKIVLELEVKLLGFESMNIKEKSA